MESTQQFKIAQVEPSKREQLLMSWLQSECGLSSTTLVPMAGDASMRRYFRVETSARSLVVMDAPPPQENCRPFIAIAKALRELGLQTPEIFFANVEQGFLLLSDFGDATYLKTLNVNNADFLYQRALDALAILQTCRQAKPHHIPLFTADFMWKEWAWHKEWFLEKLLGVAYAPIETELDACYKKIVNSAVMQPQVFMHRDFHSANLMVLPNEVGILDFQDAFIGPVTYDLVSLLRDCYIDWPEQKVQQWVWYYQQKMALDVDPNTFLQWFDYMSLQRHLKALLTFARKKVRDEQPHYLQFIPRTLNYLLNVTQRYSELTALHNYLQHTVQPTFQRLNLCVQ